MARPVAYLSAIFAALLALAIGWFVLFGASGTKCTATTNGVPSSCTSVSRAEMEPLFPTLIPVAVWSLAPLVAPFAVRARERGSQRAPGLIAAAMAVEATSIISLAGAFFALFVAPVLLLAFMTTSAVRTGDENETTS